MFIGKKIKINYSDFWYPFDKENNFFTNLLRKKYIVEISDDPDILMFSSYGFNHRKYKCIKIFFTGEYEQPNFNYCDYAFTFDYMNHPRQYRLPLYALYSGDIKNILQKKDISQVLFEKTKFCNFLYSNDMSSHRKEFFHKLSKYKKVDSGGKVLNNLGYRVKDKFEFLNQYKFTISFENASYPGYTTEKIIDPMYVNSIPIYWGNLLVEKDFNTKSFVNWHDYGSDEAVIEKIIELDQNEDLYIQMQQEPYFINNEIPYFLKEKTILVFFESIIENKTYKPIASTPRGSLYKHFVLDTKNFAHDNFHGLWKILYNIKNHGKYGK